MRSVFNRLSVGMATAVIVLAQVVMPVQAAYAQGNAGGAGNGGGNTNNSGTLQQVYCNIQGNSGTAKAQIGGQSTEHEFALLGADGKFVYAHDQKDITDRGLDAECTAQAYAATPTFTVVEKCDALDQVTRVYDATKLTMAPATPVFDANNTISATFTPIAPYLLKNAQGALVTSITLTYTDVQSQNCSPAPTPLSPTAVASLEKCTAQSGLTDAVKVTVTNTDDATNATVTYTVVLGGKTENVTVADGTTGTVTFSGLVAGKYTAVVTGTDGTATSNEVTVTDCAKTPEEKKVFVCKFVGTPGIDERLQTGDNPISVSVNSIKDYNGVGSSFNDKQGRSLVIAEDNGQPKPSTALCTKTPNKCVLPNATYTMPWTYSGVTYPVADAWPSGTPGTATFTKDGLNLITPATESETYGLFDGGNTPLSDVDKMTYRTYRDVTSTGYAQTLPAYILEIDKDGDPATTGDHAYMFYEPYNNATVVEGVWTTWDAIDGGAAKWWSGAGQVLHTWNEFKTTIFPFATVVAYGFNQGTYNAGTNATIAYMEFDCATTGFSGGMGGEKPPTDTTPTPPVVPVTPGKGAGVTQPVTELPETGAGSNALAIGLLAAIAAYGAVYFAQPKRRYE